MARYYNTQLVKPISQFVAEPLDMYQGKLEGLQKQQDAYQLELKGLNKQTDALSNDLPNVMAAKQGLEKTYQGMRDYDINDPNQKKQALAQMQSIHNELSPFGLVGAADKKKKDYDALIASIDKGEKDPMKASYLKYQAKTANLDPSNAIKIGPDGIPVNREVIPPKDFEYKDPTKYFQDFLSKVEHDSSYSNSGLRDSVIAYKKSLVQGSIDNKALQKIYDAFIPTASADLNLIESAKAIQTHLGAKDQNGNPLGVEEQADFFDQVKDKNGNVFLRPNTSTILGRTIFGIAEGGTFTRDNRKEQFEGDELGLYKAKKESDKEDFLGSLTGQTIEGTTYNGIANDKNFADLTQSGVFVTDDKGNVSINWADLNKDTKTKVVGMPEGKGIIMSAAQKQAALKTQMEKMAKTIGYTGPITNEGYNAIATAYNTFNKVRMFGEQLSDPISNLESDKITKNWEQTTAFNPDDVSKPTNKPVLAEGDKVLINQRITNQNGEMIKKGVIVRKDGTREPIALKSNSKEDTDYFDTIGNVGVTTAKYQIGEIEKPLQYQANDDYGHKKGQDMVTDDGKYVLAMSSLPGVGQIITTGDPKDKSDVEYRVITTGGQMLKYNNYSDLQRAMETEYYKKTPEGRADAQYLLSQGQQYKQIAE